MIRFVWGDLGAEWDGLGEKDDQIRACGVFTCSLAETLSK
jgi:hypothetical protein